MAAAFVGKQLGRGVPAIKSSVKKGGDVVSAGAGEHLRVKRGRLRQKREAKRLWALFGL